MRRFLAVLTLLAVASPAFTDDKDKPKPNTLTPKEIADGWILLFDGETTFGWKIDGEAKVKDGALVLVGGAKEDYESRGATTRFASYELQRWRPKEPVPSTYGQSRGRRRLSTARLSNQNNGECV